MRMKIKTFMFAALAAFATLAGCSDDENKTTGGGGNNGTGGDPVESEYKVTFSDTSYYSSVATFEAITENAKSQSFMAVVFETAFLEQQIPGITDNDIAKGVINYYKAEYMSQGATVADIYNVLTQQGRLHGSVTPWNWMSPVCRRVHPTRLSLPVSMRTLKLSLTESLPSLRRKRCPAWRRRIVLSNGRLSLNRRP